MASRIDKIGAIFSNPNGIPKASEIAIKEALEYAAGLIKADTPVLSGDLKQGFVVTDSSVINEIPYALFVEEGTKTRKGVGMIRRNKGAIEEYLIKKAGDAVVNEFN